MRCIFCKNHSTESRSIEHIIPEALGNTEHVLPRGIVCDICNNYFARKIEGPLLATPWLKHARSRQWIGNKRGLVPPMDGFVPEAGVEANVWLKGCQLTLAAHTEGDQAQLDDALLSGCASKVYIPIVSKFDKVLMSRFLGKAAIEILAQRALMIGESEEAVTDNSQIDQLRRFVRIGDRPLQWPFSQRRIYGENALHDETDDIYQVLHEFTLLYTNACELYAVICIFGEEFAINLGGPDTEGYFTWLKEHREVSPLYCSEKH